MPSAPTADTLYLETDLDISQTLVIVETSSVEDGHDVCHALLIDGATVASNAAKCVITPVTPIVNLSPVAHFPMHFVSISRDSHCH